MNSREFTFSASHRGVSCHNTPYQNCIQNLSPNADLERFQTSLVQALPLTEPKSEFHVSLKYGLTSCKDLHEEIVQLTNDLPATVRFDRIRLVELAGRPGDWINT